MEDFFLHRIYMCYLKDWILFQSAALFWNGCRGKLSFSQILTISHHHDFMLSARWGLFQASLLSACFTRWHVMRLTWLANQIWRGRGGQWHDFLQSVSHYIEISFKKICACLGWNRCQICPKDMDQRLLPTHTTQIKTAFSWIAFFLLKQSFPLVWVLHKIHILISLKCLLIICTILTMENIKMEVLDSSVLSETCGKMQGLISLERFTLFQHNKELFGNSLYLSSIVLLLCLSVLCYFCFGL